MKLSRFRFFTLLFIVGMFACQQGSKTDSAEQVEEAAAEETDAGLATFEKDGIKLTEMVSPAFDDAALTVLSPREGTHFNEDVRFEFGVENYELGSQTADAAVKNCANSGKGQHIHLILNNGPYSAHYEAAFQKETESGSYAGLAFLSRSYHESIKTSSAYQLFNFTVGDLSEEDKAFTFDQEAPHLFYSRPKGTYNGEDTEKVMLDFFLVNTDLSKDGSKVRAKINGVEFMLDKWVPYYMEGLPDGETTIELALLNADGELVESPFNPVVRTVTLAR